MATVEQIAALRRMTDEPDSDVYSDLDFQSIIDQAEEDMDLAAADIWRQKAARFSTLTDVSESGSSRKMSQLHGAALTQAKFYEDRANPAPVAEVQRSRVRSATRR